jgi:hypothetical protein
VRCSLARLVENSESSQLWRVAKPAIRKNRAINDIYHCKAQTKHLGLSRGGGRGSVCVWVVSILVRNRYAFSVTGFFVRASGPLTSLLRDQTDRAKRLLADGHEPLRAPPLCRTPATSKVKYRLPGDNFRPLCINWSRWYRLCLAGVYVNFIYREGFSYVEVLY